ncbi:MAG: hypothetical protein ACLUGJ_18690 [Blautia wexlerae]
MGRAGEDESSCSYPWTDREQMTQCLEKVAQRYERGIRVYQDTPLSYAAGFALAGDFPEATNERTV